MGPLFLILDAKLDIFLIKRSYCNANLCNFARNILNQIRLTIKMKRLIPIIFMLVLSNVILSCGNNSMKNATLQQDSAKVTFTGISNVVYAHAGADSTDTTLDVIPMGKDPIQFNDVDAKKKGDLLGFFDTGDRIAVALSNDGKQLLKAVDITSFVGRWITGDSLSDINAKGFNLNADGSSNTISHRPQDENYTNWNIVDIDLKLTVTSRRQKKRAQTL